MKSQSLNSIWFRSSWSSPSGCKGSYFPKTRKLSINQACVKADPSSLLIIHQILQVPDSTVIMGEKEILF
jgi:hypothetical protein